MFLIIVSWYIKVSKIQKQGNKVLQRLLTVIASNTHLSDERNSLGIRKLCEPNLLHVFLEIERTWKIQAKGFFRLRSWRVVKIGFEAEKVFTTKLLAKF